MAKSYLNNSQENLELEDYCDKKNKRFPIKSQKDADQLFGKIRRLTGRDEIRKNAIKIIVRKRLNIPDSLLDSWDDVAMSDNSEFFKYLDKEERDKIPDQDFGYVKGKRRLFPILDQEDLTKSIKLVNESKSFSDEEREYVVKKLRVIAKRKGLSF